MYGWINYVKMDIFLIDHCYIITVIIKNEIKKNIFKVSQQIKVNTNKSLILDLYYTCMKL